jgi:FtsH-binding integral membrane protein
MMNEAQHPLHREAVLASEAPADARRDFIKRTYAHLGVAILAFVGLEYLLLNSPVAPKMLSMLGTSRFSWLFVLGAFMLVAWFAEKWARSSASPGMQYLGLAVYVIAEAVIFIPLLYIATHFARYDGLLGTAALITGIVFVGLTAMVFLTKHDFSWMRGMLYAGGMVAMGVLVASLIFGFNLGTIYSGAIVLLASGYIVYHTSAILREYPIGSHVAASLALFASIALLFWYILRILMDRR